MSSPRAILLVRNLLHPIDVPAIDSFLNGDVTHGIGRGCTMPVLHARRNPHHVARLDLALLAAPVLNPARSGGDDQNLPGGVRVPGAARAGLEGHMARAHARLRTSAHERVDHHGARERLGRAFAGRAGSVGEYLDSLRASRRRYDGCKERGCDREFLHNKCSLSQWAVGLLSNTSFAAGIAEKTKGQPV